MDDYFNFQIQPTMSWQLSYIITQYYWDQIQSERGGCKLLAEFHRMHDTRIPNKFMSGGTTWDKKFENMIWNAYSYHEVNAFKGSCVLNLPCLSDVSETDQQKSVSVTRAKSPI